MYFIAVFNVRLYFQPDIEVNSEVFCWFSDWSVWLDRHRPCFAVWWVHECGVHELQKCHTAKMGKHHTLQPVCFILQIFVNLRTAGMNISSLVDAEGMSQNQ